MLWWGLGNICNELLEGRACVCLPPFTVYVITRIVLEPRVGAQEMSLEWMNETVAIIAERLLCAKLAYNISSFHRQESEAGCMSLVSQDRWFSILSTPSRAKKEPSWYEIPGLQGHTLCLFSPRPL